RYARTRAGSSVTNRTNANLLASAMRNYRQSLRCARTQLGEEKALRLHTVYNNRDGRRFEVTAQNLVYSRTLNTVVKTGSRRTPSWTFTTEEVRDLQEIRMETPGSELAIEIQFNCRVWLRQAIRVLMQQRMVCCERIKYLEDELERVAT
ncbi:hypothetical protein POSPLADRAFT_1112785, partial [Postia placenta MAD-698-R-SB12]